MHQLSSEIRVLTSRRTVLLGALALMTGCKQKLVIDQQPSPTFKGVDLTGASYGRDFKLKDVQGRERTLADYRGKVVLLHFGFTMCPDVCPTALTRAAQVRALLGDRADRLQVLFVTLDPERDTPQVMAAYPAQFDPSFIGLYGDLEQTRAVADQFKVFYRKVPTGDSYTLDHSVLSFAFDPQGRLRVGIRNTESAEDCAHDLRELLT
jgi:protein SCO1/2